MFIHSSASQLTEVGAIVVYDIRGEGVSGGGEGGNGGESRDHKRKSVGLARQEDIRTRAGYGMPFRTWVHGGSYGNMHGYAEPSAGARGMGNRKLGRRGTSG